MKISLRTKFLAPALLILFVGITIFGGVTYSQVRNTLVDNTDKQMTIHVDTASEHLASWVKRAATELGHWAEEKVYRNALPETFLGKAARRNAQGNLVALQKKYGFCDLITLTSPEGKPIASSHMEDAEAMMKHEMGNPIADLGAGEKVYKVFRSPLTGNPTLLISVPVQEGDLVGTMSAYINLTSFRKAFMENIKLGKTGQAFLINTDGLVVGYNTENETEAIEFTINVVDAGLDSDFASRQRKTIRHDLKRAGKETQKQMTVVRSVEGTDLVVVVTAPAKEILSAANSVSLWMAAMALLLLLALGGGTLALVEINVIKPIKVVRAGLKEVAQGQGDLTQRIRVSSQDEVGDLARWFNQFMEHQQAMIREIMESANSLATLTSQISATATQFASSATEMVSSVSEISTTSEEVKETVRLSSEKAEGVATSAEETEMVSKTGLRATDMSIAGMNRIKDEMEYIAESIVKLSEQTQNIAEIIEAVNEVANQSNLLSVNASIEAAKAGEFGKGFSVVAQEVKSLSDQSKQATNQVKGILMEIQNATSAAVMATERGSKAVDDGSDLSSQAEGAIRKLSHSTSESAKSSRQIAASSQQQLAGMEQLAQAMESIKFACQQNVESAKQLEDSTGSLSDLGQALKSMAGKFKV